MTEAEARRWIRDRFGVSRETILADFVEAIMGEASRQNLVARSSLETIWGRHIVDSAQLLSHAGPDNNANWLDIGSGAGFPGLVIGALSEHRVTLCEPRRRRAEFLQGTVKALKLNDNVVVEPCKVEALTLRATVISARAVAELTRLLASARHCASRKTIWLLPKGRSAREEVAVARKTWHGSFHVEHSITDPESLIVIAKGVSPR